MEAAVVAPLLLDTCAVIWLAENARISGQAREMLSQAGRLKLPIHISPITGWEIGMLAAKGRLRLSADPNVWFDRILANPAMRLTDISPKILIASSFLPGSPPNDPMDRIIAASARENGLRLMTRDKRLLKYAEQGHMQSIAC
jgi:PIN domain nuclease of toxin-antitoxin system